jgi:hypothetical protein
MPSTGFGNAHKLDNNTISQIVTRTSAGAYALGYVNNGTFNVSYIGRADSDVADRLKKHVGKYASFKFGYFSSPKAAFEKECHLYHDFNPPDNKIHPDRPNGSGWKCPCCKNFD